MPKLILTSNHTVYINTVHHFPKRNNVLHKKLKTQVRCKKQQETKD